jgi:hypothetical protein
MTKCLLEGCDKEARRKFCSDKHKDRYHNIHNPRGYYAHLNPYTDEYEWDLDDVPPSR